MTQENVLEVRNLSKSFGAVQALSNVSFTVGKSEIVGLVGDNGAGKSTIINLLMGVYQPDEGEIYFEGKRVTFDSPRNSRATGIEPVYQNTAVVDLMNLWRNFYLGREVTKSFGPFGVLDKKEMKKKSIEMMWDIGVHVREADESVQYMSGGERQSLCIGRCMEFSGKLLLLDEPTAALSLKETDKVLKFAESVREKGLSEIIVDHNIIHIYPIVDKFVIMERGRKVTELRKNDVSAEDVIGTLMKL
ncbi:MAG: ATP-binding cassette domain-containing protein [Spirochaetia bacterium]|jgi:simple sugar transport system ATP-binding protein